MRKLILCTLAAVSLASVGHAAAAVGEGSTGMAVHAEGIGTMLGGKAPQVQVSSTMQALFNSSSLNGARLTPAVARSTPGFDASESVVGDLLPAEGGSSGAILLAGALVVVAVVLRRLS
ncbi:hypothetical protein [Zoogloea sp.]|uniref:hypothetical protein n=1 Tax=Zoogloea sp. TaxID=49181 RepID=UPI0014161092|nr:MAG: hypothetical protein F9K15_11820 [Zoogloea sp.]